jgi:hypothetical protein
MSAHSRIVGIKRKIDYSEITESFDVFNGEYV